MAITLPNSTVTTPSPAKSRRRSWLICLALPLVALVGYLVLSLDARAASVLSPVLAIPDRIQSWRPWRHPVSAANEGVGQDPDGEAEGDDIGIPVSNGTSLAAASSPAVVLEGAQATATETASKMRISPSTKPRPTPSKAALPLCERTLLYAFARAHASCTLACELSDLLVDRATRLRVRVQRLDQGSDRRSALQLHSAHRRRRLELWLAARLFLGHRTGGSRRGRRWLHQGISVANEEEGPLVDGSRLVAAEGQGDVGRDCLGRQRQGVASRA